MPREEQCFKFDVEFAKDGDQEVHEPLRIAVQRNKNIKTEEDAKAHILAPIGTQDGVTITRIHYKELSTGMFFPVVKCTPVDGNPFSINQAPKLKSLHDAPHVPQAPSA